MIETFSFSPLIEYQQTASHRVLVTEFESGKEERKYLGTRPRTWILQFRDKPSTIQDIVIFFNARNGNFETFYWQPITEDTPILVRFENDSLQVDYSGTYYADCEVTLREVL